MLANRRTAAKREIVLKALQEDSDLDALRREKRAIMEEEKRLKALLDIEKTNSHAKADLLVAQRIAALDSAVNEELSRHRRSLGGQKQQKIRKNKEKLKKIRIFKDFSIFFGFFLEILISKFWFS